MEEISFFSGIPQFVCLLLIKGESPYNYDGRSIVEADLLLAWWRCYLHVGEHVTVLLLLLLCCGVVALLGGRRRHRAPRRPRRRNDETHGQET